MCNRLISINLSETDLLIIQTQTCSSKLKPLPLFQLFRLKFWCCAASHRPAFPACPASRPKKEPGVSNRNINDFMDRGSLPFWSKVLEQHSTSGCSRQQVGQTWQQPLLPGRTEWKVIATGELISGWLISYQGN